MNDNSLHTPKTEANNFRTIKSVLCRTKYVHIIFSEEAARMKAYTE